MDAMNLVIGAVLFVVVMIVLVTNNQKVSDLKKSIKTSAVEAPVSVAHGLLARNSSGDYVPKKAYYLKLIDKPSYAPDKQSGVVDQIFVQYGGRDGSDGLHFAMDLYAKKCKLLYRPETRVLYTVESASVYENANWNNMDSYLTPGGLPSAGIVLVNLKRNTDTDSDTPMFSNSEIKTSDGSARFRTIIAVPAPMGGNTASGV